MPSYRLAHITDLATLTDADVAQLAAELPTLVAALRLAARNSAPGQQLSEMLPHITFATDIGDQVVLGTSSGPLPVPGAIMRTAERTDEAARQAIRRAQRRP